MFGAFLEPPVSPLLVATVSDLHGSVVISPEQALKALAGEVEPVKEQGEGKKPVAKSKARVTV